MSNGLDSVLGEFAASQNCESTTITNSDLFKSDDPFSALMNPNPDMTTDTNTSTHAENTDANTDANDSVTTEDIVTTPSEDRNSQPEGEDKSTSTTKPAPATKSKGSRRKSSTKCHPVNDGSEPLDKSEWTDRITIRFSKEEGKKFRMCAVANGSKMQMIGRTAILDKLSNTYTCPKCGLTIVSSSDNGEAVDLSGKSCYVCGTHLVLVEY